MDVQTFSAEAGDQIYLVYNVRMSDGSPLPQDITINSIFGKRQTSANYGETYTFDALVPFGYTAKILRYDSEDADPIDLTGKREDLPEDIRADYVVNDGYPLGMEPIYNGYNSVNTAVGPRKYTREATFYGYEVTGSRTIVAELTKNTREPVFDFHWAIQSIGMNGRGSTGTANQIGGPLWPNIVTEDNWQWQGGVFGKDPKTLTGGDLTKYKTHFYLDEDTNTYTLDLVFQTNSGNFLLNLLSINDQAITVPYVPEETWVGNTLTENRGEGYRGTFAETVVDETVVKLRMLRIFNSTQRVYRLTITGAQHDMVVTSGNLMMFGQGAPELDLRTLFGVSSDGVTHTSCDFYAMGEWELKNQGEPLVSNNLGTFRAGDPTHYKANIRFKVLPGYENPLFVYSSAIGNTILETNGDEDGFYNSDNSVRWDEVEDNLTESGELKSNYLYGPDEEGYYYIRLYNFPSEGNNKMLNFDVIASALKYVIRYMVGNVYDETTNIPGEIIEGSFIPAKIDNMPSFDPKRNPWDGLRDKTTYVDDNAIERYDDNNGKFYDSVTYTNTTIADNIPIDSTDTKQFKNWVVVDRNEDPILVDGTLFEINANTAVRLEYFLPYAILLDKELGGDEDNYHVIRLKTAWE